MLAVRSAATSPRNALLAAARTSNQYLCKPGTSGIDFEHDAPSVCAPFERPKANGQLELIVCRKCHSFRAILEGEPLAVEHHADDGHVEC